jgi:hypothetical protein
VIVMSEQSHRLEQKSIIARRQFLGTISSAAAAAWIGLGREASAADTAPASLPPLPTIQLGKYRISRIVAGANPLSGYSYQGAHTDSAMKEYFTLERRVEFLERCQRAGITAHQFSTHTDSEYLQVARQRGVKLHYFGLHTDRTTLKDVVAKLQPIAMVHHGGATDRAFGMGKGQDVHDFVKAAHDAGIMAGVSAHNPDNIKQIANEAWEVDFFMTCFYFVTRDIVPGAEEKAPPVPTLEISHPFFKDDPMVMTEVIRQVKQPCLGFKILAAGRACRNDRRVREAFKFAFTRIKPIDGVIVGMYPRYADEIQFDAQATRDYGRPPA